MGTEILPALHRSTQSSHQTTNSPTHQPQWWNLEPRGRASPDGYRDPPCTASLNSIESPDNELTNSPASVVELRATGKGEPRGVPRSSLHCIAQLNRVTRQRTHQLTGLSGGT